MSNANLDGSQVAGQCTVIQEFRNSCGYTEWRRQKLPSMVVAELAEAANLFSRQIDQEN